MPSGRFGADSARVQCAAITHNVVRAAGILAGPTWWPAAPRCAAESQPPRRVGPTLTPGRHTPTQSLAVGAGMDHAVAQHLGYTPNPPPSDHPAEQALPEHTRKVGQTSDYLYSHDDRTVQSTFKPHHQVDPRIEA